MPLVQRILPVLAGAMLDINTTTSQEEFHYFRTDAVQSRFGRTILLHSLNIARFAWTGPPSNNLS